MLPVFINIKNYQITENSSDLEVFIFPVIEFRHRVNRALKIRLSSFGSDRETCRSKPCKPCVKILRKPLFIGNSEASQILPQQTKRILTITNLTSSNRKICSNQKVQLRCKTGLYPLLHSLIIFPFIYSFHFFRFYVLISRFVPVADSSIHFYDNEINFGTR